MKVFKLTDQDGYTRRGESNETRWAENTTHTATGPGTELCTPDVIHVYIDPLIAAFMNPVHANLADPLCREADTPEIVASEGQLKAGVKTLTTLQLVPLPVITTEQRVTIGIKCAMRVSTNESWLKWANAWLDGSNRSKVAAEAAWAAAARAAWAAAARAAWAAAARAARAAAAARAARAAAAAAADLPLLDIIREVIQ